MILIFTSQNILCQTYYWNKGNKIQITPNSNLFYISSNDSLSLVKASFGSAVAVNSVQKRGRFQEAQKRYWQIVRVSSTSMTGSVIDAKSLASNASSSSVYVAPVYNNTNPIATSEYFYVQLKSSGDYSILLTEATNKACQIVKQVPYMPLWYVLKAPRTSNGITMANAFYETSKFQEVDPAFMFDFKPTCTTDPMFSQQWGLKNSNGIDVNACNAWSLTKGTSSVVVAVLDQGVDQNHKEFSSNFSSLSYDLNNNSKPSVVRGDHGTHVGGIIGANHNGVQVSGIAPSATLLSISHEMMMSPTFSSEMATGFGYARDNGAAVMNNSWGDQGGGFYQGMKSAILEDAIKSAITSGRGGKGMVVVFASGNYGYSSEGLDYPGNCNPDILTVGSISTNASKAYSSSYGNELDVVAPGDNILSTLPSNSTGYMSGTSMAAPHVAGIAALVLSVNPNLTGKEVRDIIEGTSRKVGGYTYGTSKANGTWNNNMGYGLVDAYAAVLKAKNGGCNTITYSNQTVTTNTAVNGCIVNATNDYVNSGKLTITATDKTIINPVFEVRLGAELELKYK